LASGGLRIVGNCSCGTPHIVRRMSRKRWIRL
jgi:hypothetical protein